MTTKIKERGILMHARSVNGILAGRKTQTRRIIKPQPTHSPDSYGLAIYRGNRHEWWPLHDPDFPTQDPALRCPQGQPGDRLWVREAWRYYASALSPEANFGIQFRADGAINYWPDWDKAMQAQCSPSAAWRPSLFMPRWASRITLEIVNVRVERVQDISEDDAKAEGVNGGCTVCGELDPCGCANPSPDHRDSFIWLWDDTNGKGAWDRNDWVWVIEFKRVEETA